MSSGFITESEILEARRRRQEEWDKVRTEDQPQGKIVICFDQCLSMVGIDKNIILLSNDIFPLKFFHIKSRDKIKFFTMHILSYIFNTTFYNNCALVTDRKVYGPA